jgi:phospholipase/lecithinase/hemolysin
MLSRFGLAVAAFAAVGCGPAFAATPFSAIYSFGDSLSDAGNLYTISQNPIYGIPHQPLSPYSDGRFTDGNVWVQDLAQMLHMPAVTASLLGGNDYAYGGATTGTTDIHAATLIDLPSQVEQFAAEHPGGASSTALYTIWAGANDIFAALDALETNAINMTEADAVVGEAAENEAEAAAELHTLGAEDFLVINVPNLGLTPAYLGSGQQAEATTLAKLFDTDLEAAFASLRGITVYTVDAFDLLDYAVANPDKYGFTDVSSACWTGGFTGGNGSLCSDPDQHLFWDDVHPTSIGHQIVADAAIGAIGAAAPEPSTWALMLVGFAGFGAFAGLKRRAAA